jgi:hypothetical protein
MRTCGLVTAGECGSRLNAVGNVYERRNREIDKPRTGADEHQRTCTPRDTGRYFALHS